MGKRVFCKVDKHNNVIEAVRGVGVVREVGDIDVTEVEGSNELTEAHAQKRRKVIPSRRSADGRRNNNEIMKKPDMMFKANKQVIKANGRDAAIVVIESITGEEYRKPIKIRINGDSTTVMLGEKFKITSNVAQRIGIKDVDPDVMIVPKTFFIQATKTRRGGIKDETHSS